MGQGSAVCDNFTGAPSPSVIAPGLEKPEVLTFFSIYRCQNHQEPGHGEKSHGSKMGKKEEILFDRRKKGNFLPKLGYFSYTAFPLIIKKHLLFHFSV